MLKPEELLAQDETSVRNRIKVLLTEESSATKRLETLRAQAGESALRAYIDSLQREISSLEDYTTRLRECVKSLESSVQTLNDVLKHKEEVAKIIIGVLLTGVEALLKEVEILAASASSSIAVLEQNSEALLGTERMLQELSGQRAKAQEELQVMEDLQKSGKVSLGAEIASKRAELAEIARQAQIEQGKHDTYTRWQETLNTREHDLNVLSDRVKPIYQAVFGENKLNSHVFEAWHSTTEKPLPPTSSPRPKLQLLSLLQMQEGQSPSLRIQSPEQSTGQIVPSPSPTPSELPSSSSLQTVLTKPPSTTPSQELQSL